MGFFEYVGNNLDDARRGKEQLKRERKAQVAAYRDLLFLKRRGKTKPEAETYSLLESCGVQDARAVIGRRVGNLDELDPEFRDAQVMIEALILIKERVRLDDGRIQPNTGEP